MSKLRRIAEAEASMTSYSAEEADQHFGGLPIINAKVECPVFRDIIGVEGCGDCSHCYGTFASQGGHWIRCARATRGGGGFERAAATVERTKKFASANPAPTRAAKPVDRSWERVASATRYQQRPFVPETEEDMRGYSNYDVSRNSVRRIEASNDSDEYGTYYTGGRYEQRMYTDPESIAELLMEDTQARIDAAQRVKTAKAERELRQAELDAERQEWAESRLRGRNGELLSSSDVSRSRGYMTSAENVVAGRFGMLDEDRVAEAHRRWEQERQAGVDRSKLIKRARMTESERRDEEFNREKLRSQTQQMIWSRSKVMGNLSDLLRD